MRRGAARYSSLAAVRRTLWKRWLRGKGKQRAPSGVKWKSKFGYSRTRLDSASRVVVRFSGSLSPVLTPQCSSPVVDSYSRGRPCVFGVVRSPESFRWLLFFFLIIIFNFSLGLRNSFFVSSFFAFRVARSATRHSVGACGALRSQRRLGIFVRVVGGWPVGRLTGGPPERSYVSISVSPGAAAGRQQTADKLKFRYSPLVALRATYRQVRICSFFQQLIARAVISLIRFLFALRPPAPTAAASTVECRVSSVDRRPGAAVDSTQLSSLFQFSIVWLFYYSGSVFSLSSAFSRPLFLCFRRLVRWRAREMWSLAILAASPSLVLVAALFARTNSLPNPKHFFGLAAPPLPPEVSWTKFAKIKLK